MVEPLEERRKRESCWRQLSLHIYVETRPSPGLLGSYRDIANAALAGGCIPDSWKRGVIFPIENIEGVVMIEKHRPIMLIAACKKAYIGILIKRTRKVWDKTRQ